MIVRAAGPTAKQTKAISASDCEAQLARVRWVHIQCSSVRFYLTWSTASSSSSSPSSSTWAILKEIQSNTTHSPDIYAQACHQTVVSSPPTTPTALLGHLLFACRPLLRLPHFHVCKLLQCHGGGRQAISEYARSYDLPTNTTSVMDKQSNRVFTTIHYGEAPTPPPYWNAYYLIITFPLTLDSRVISRPGDEE